MNFCDDQLKTKILDNTNHVPVYLYTFFKKKITPEIAKDLINNNMKFKIKLLTNTTIQRRNKISKVHEDLPTKFWI